MFTLRQRRVSLVAAIILLSVLPACQNASTISVPVGQVVGFHLAPVQPAAAQGVQVAGKPSDGPTAPLTIAVKTAGLAAQRRVLSTVADVNHVLVDVVAADGSEYQATITQAQLSNGQGSATFAAIPVGNATITLKAFDANGLLIGQASQGTDVVVGVTTPVSLSLTLNPTYTGGSASSGSGQTGGISVSGTLHDGPTINGTPPPAPTQASRGTVLGSFTLPQAVTVGSIAADAHDNAWLIATPTGSSAAQSQVIEVSPTGNEIGSFAVPSDSMNLVTDNAGCIWVLSYTSTVNGRPIFLSRYSSAGTLLGQYTLPYPTTSPGSFYQAPPLAVDPTTGDVWVVLAGNSEALKFDQSLTVVATADLSSVNAPCALAVDSQAGVYVGDASGGVAKFDPTGLEIGTFSNMYTSGEAVTGIGADLNGNLWTDGHGATGGVLTQFKASTASLLQQYSQSSDPGQLGIDNAGNVWVCNGSQITVNSPQGQVIGQIAVPNHNDWAIAMGATRVWVFDSTTATCLSQ